jgi:hypothetical protein
MNRLDLAWLAGFWDGEGSIGLSNNKKTKILTCQLSHTEFDTVKKILSILESENVSGRGYTYQERDPSKHRDAHYIRVTGMANILSFAKLIMPYAVTKKRHWEIAIEWAERRIKVCGGVDSKGHLLRGGIPGTKKYSEDDLRLASELFILNRRGPEDRKTREKGRIK